VLQAKLGDRQTIPYWVEIEKRIIFAGMRIEEMCLECNLIELFLSFFWKGADV
jgi:hypothetical protein